MTNNNNESICKGVILIIDDEIEILDILKMWIEDKGFLVHCFDEPKEATLFFKENHNQIDAVISDYNMPRIKGTNLIKEFTEISPTTKYIIATGDFSIEEDNSNIELLRKPYDFEQLDKMLNKLSFKKL